MYITLINLSFITLVTVELKECGLGVSDFNPCNLHVIKCSYEKLLTSSNIKNRTLILAGIASYNETLNISRVILIFRIKLQHLRSSVRDTQYIIKSNRGQYYGYSVFPKVTKQVINYK
jgi:hypothetical protein